jgi:hypothetical protein
MPGPEGFIIFDKVTIMYGGPGTTTTVSTSTDIVYFLGLCQGFIDWIGKIIIHRWTVFTGYPKVLSHLVP